MKWQNRKWFVWLAEYPEEGSTVVEALSAGHAIAIVRAEWAQDAPEDARDAELCAVLAYNTVLSVWEKLKS